MEGHTSVPWKTTDTEVRVGGGEEGDLESTGTSWKSFYLPWDSRGGWVWQEPNRVDW